MRPIVFKMKKWVVKQYSNKSKQLLIIQKSWNIFIKITSTILVMSNYKGTKQCDVSVDDPPWKHSTGHSFH